MPPPTKVQTTPQVSLPILPSVSVVFTTSPTVGNSIVVPFLAFCSTQSFTCTDNKGNTYTLVTRQQNVSMGVAMFVCTNIVNTGSSFTITISNTANTYWEACAIEVTGNIAIDQIQGQTAAIVASATTGSTPVITSADVFVVSVAAIGNNQASITVESVSPSWSQELENLNYSATVAGEVDIRSLTGVLGSTQSCSWTYSTAATSATIIAVFKPVGGTVVGGGENISMSAVLF